LKEIRNANGKLLCRLDEKKSMIEIVHKGIKTQIYFKPNGMVEIIDTTPKAPT